MNTNTTLMGDIAGVNWEQVNGALVQDHSINGSALSGLVAQEGLDTGNVTQVRALAEEVRRADSVGLKLNWETRDPRIPNQVSDFCYYVGGRLVGYAPLDGDGDELEVTAAVLPSHRRQGVFRLLLNAARQEAHRRGARRLLLVSYPASRSGAVAVNALGLPYISSEYRMEAEADDLPPLDAGRVRLIQVDESNVTDLVRLMGLTFGERWSANVLTERLREMGARYFITEVEAVRIGQVGVVEADGGIYVRGVGIIPERRRLGFGRQLLAATLRVMLSEGHTRFSLDVATDNPQALTLYETCGFRQTEAYDYHDVPLAEPERSMP